MEGASQACAQFQSIFNFTTQSVDSKREIFDQQKRGSLEPVCGKGGRGLRAHPSRLPPPYWHVEINTNAPLVEQAI